MDHCCFYGRPERCSNAAEKKVERERERERGPISFILHNERFFLDGLLLSMYKLEANRDPDGASEHVDFPTQLTTP